MFFETFVATELHRQVSWLEDRPTLFRFRDRDQREADIVIERRDGTVARVEVKSAATVRASDVRGLNHLRGKLGAGSKPAPCCTRGASTVTFGDRLAAVPLPGLWVS